MAKNEKQAAQAATANTLASVLASLPAPARQAAPVTPPKHAASECGKAWLLAAYAAKQAGKRPSGEQLRKLAAEHGLNVGNVAQESSRYFRWAQQQGKTETEGFLPAAWNVTLN